MNAVVLITVPLTSHFVHLELTNAMVLLMMLPVAFDGIKPYNNTISHVASCFSHLDLTNKMVPLIVSSVSFHSLFQL